MRLQQAQSDAFGSRFPQTPPPPPNVKGPSLGAGAHPAPLQLATCWHQPCWSAACCWEPPALPGCSRQPCGLRPSVLLWVWAGAAGKGAQITCWAARKFCSRALVCQSRWRRLYLPRCLLSRCPDGLPDWAALWLSSLLASPRSLLLAPPQSVLVHNVTNNPAREGGGGFKGRGIQRLPQLWGRQGGREGWFFSWCGQVSPGVLSQK